ncbi:putative 2-ketogluconate reductase [Merluccius polli]|uniref:Glyoxylate reductase/hydroxypyruvate reductase n=1 Tax=Merluccius polli TaxID=89951 RepID=A0AA47MHS8_MERPO|nr:putative 2-ketogluconate reductase [Merluccius polli]
MEADKPLSLISGVGGKHGFSEEHADLIRQHFRTVCYSDLLINPHLYAPKIQAVFIWKSNPVIQRCLLQSLPSLKVIATEGVGFDRLDLRYIANMGVKVTNARGVASDATADLAMALLLASARRIVQGHQTAAGGPEPTAGTHRLACDVTGSTLGIIGMGDVGYKVARRSTGFEMNVLYHNRTQRSSEDEEAVGAGYCGNMDDLLRNSDYVVLAVNLSPGATALIGHRELSLMKPSAILVNISSGLVVDPDALVQALQSGTIHSAALDVTHPDPLPRSHPLRSLPNVLRTPRLGSSTARTGSRMVQRMVHDALAVLTHPAVPDQVQSESE